MACACEKQVYFTCLRMLGNQQDAEDCAQEAMLRAYRAFDSFRGDAAFSTWIIRIAMNCCNDYLRRQKNVLSLDEMQETGFEARDASSGPYGQLEDKERMRLLHQALRQLKEEYRRLIVLRDMQGFSYEELAETLNLNLGTVKSRLSRARKELCEILLENAELFPSESVKRNGGGKA